MGEDAARLSMEGNRSRVTVAAPVEEEGPPSNSAGILAFILVGVSLIVAYAVDLGEGFTPRVETIDALAGLAIMALIVDRLLTFVPPWGAAGPAAQREIDLTVLRLGYGAFLGAALVILTDLRAVQALTSDASIQVNPGFDRLVAVLAIAGGVAGLARVLGAINPQPATDGDLKEPDAAQPVEPPPSRKARVFGLIAAGVGALFALTALGDSAGVDLVGPGESTEGTTALVVRLGLVLVAAAVVQELVELGGRARNVVKHNRGVVLGGVAVILGVIAARLLDLYLLHNIGFFGMTNGGSLNDALANSSDLELWADAFLTGLVIAAGTKPIHDVSSRLRKAKTTS
jgi:hypothetical protein